MRRLSLRRFPHGVVRRRQQPGMRNQFGEFVPGQTVEVILPASIQPAKLEELALPEGSRYSERLVVFVPVGVERVVGSGEIISWAGDELLLNGEPVQWGGTIAGDSEPLAAAFEEAEADEVLYAGLSYVVEESQLWPGSHVKAVLLRET